MVLFFLPFREIVLIIDVDFERLSVFQFNIEPLV
jgi:hypothetical protein